jgi:hypothetical protein
LKNSAAAPRTRHEFPDSRLVGCSIQALSAPEAAVGVDVGEDFLDLAILRSQSLAIEHHRIALDGIQDDPLLILAARLRERCPDAGPGWLALIDSPRWPRDLDYSRGAIHLRDPVPPGRVLDHALRAMLRASERHRAIRLSMFPTPVFGYFSHCAGAPGCKPHLRAIYHQLFKTQQCAASDNEAASRRLRGGHFTRFMLAGFLTFKAWQELGIHTLEAYPDLQFRLSTAISLPPKRAGKAAIAARIAVIRRYRHALGIGMASLPSTHDQADAEILALSAMSAARQGSLAALKNPAEGRFLLTF